VYSTLVNSNTIQFKLVETATTLGSTSTSTASGSELTNFNSYAFLNLYGWDIRFLDNIFTIFLSDFTFCDKIWYKADFLKATLSFAFYTTDVLFSVYDYFDSDLTY